MRKLLAGVFLAISSLWAASDYYAGGIAAVATLSADAESEVSTNTSQVSLYKPFNGPAVNAFFGRYLGDYVAIQANYIWNANGLTFVSTSVLPQGTAFYQQERNSSQNSIIGDALVYFRGRSSRVRPYLSAGTGLVHLRSTERKLDALSGAVPALPPNQFDANIVGLRVAVGIDIRVGRGFSARYSFSETISANPLSNHLSPPGQRVLKNFQNLWGFVKRF
jgi:Outer membrane protein beta-barrel domain